MTKKLSFLALALCTVSTAAAAESTISIYTGHQSAPHSRVWGDDTGGGGAVNFDFIAGWDGLPFAMPPHYGIRYTKWNDSGWGFGVDFNHNKVYADADTLSGSGFEVLEFSDGLNTLTVNATKKGPANDKGISYFAGGGIGVNIPHVEVKTTSGSDLTFNYQVAGPAAMLHAGAEMPVGERSAIFAEYKITYNMVRAKLTGGGYLNTDVITNAFNVGWAYKF